MKVMFVSHSSVTQYHQQKLKILAEKFGVNINLVTPAYWYESGVKTELYTENKSLNYYKGRAFILKNRMFHFYFDCKGLFKKIKPDIVHIEEIPFNPVCWQFLKRAKKYKAKTIFFTWENMRRKLNPLYRYFYKYSIKNSDCAIAGNEEGKIILQELGFNKDIYVLPQYGINPEDFKDRKKLFPDADENFNITYIGRVVPEKGIEILIDSLNGLNNIKLFIAGAGNPHYINYIKKKNFNDKIIWAGHITNKDIPSFLEKMHILILPSLTTHNWKEQFGRVLIEAFAAKVAVVGSSSGEIPNVLGDAGLIFKEGDSRDLNEKLKLLISNKDLFLSNIEKGYKRVKENYTNEKIAEKIFSIYKKLLNQ